MFFCVDYCGDTRDFTAIINGDYVNVYGREAITVPASPASLWRGDFMCVQTSPFNTRDELGDSALQCRLAYHPASPGQNILSATLMNVKFQK